MSTPFALTVVMELGPGKAQRFTELFNTAAEYSKANEPFVLTYELTLGRTDPTSNEPTVALVKEVYEDSAAFEKHRANPTVKALIAAVEAEKLISKSQIIFCDPQLTTGYKLSKF
ncbi:hypothetical protein F5Y19DRAFT_479786 [Xylariaceae sp. FL1651]|nr:hypothetical protein F5Y19DRAFT_479786 [Xylariaceae sp. FL1651]